MNQTPWPYDYGRARTIRPANPAAGADFTQTVETNSIWVILSVQLLLTTAITVANRNVHLTLSDPTGEFLDIGQQFVQVASLAITYDFYTHPEDLNTTPTGQKIADFPPRFFLNEGDIVASRIAAIAAADTITNIRIRVLEWLIAQV